MKSEPLNYRELICKCPKGHLLGTITQTRTGVWWGARPLRDGRQVETSALPTGEKVKARCTACRMGADYQASWATVSEKLAEARNTRRARTTLIFG